MPRAAVVKPSVRARASLSDARSEVRITRFLSADRPIFGIGVLCRLATRSPHMSKITGTHPLHGRSLAGPGYRTHMQVRCRCLVVQANNARALSDRLDSLVRGGASGVCLGRCVRLAGALRYRPRRTLPALCDRFCTRCSSHDFLSAAGVPASSAGGCAPVGSGRLGPVSAHRASRAADRWCGGRPVRLPPRLPVGRRLPVGVVGRAPAFVAFAAPFRRVFRARPEVPGLLLPDAVCPVAGGRRRARAFRRSTARSPRPSVSSLVGVLERPVVRPLGRVLSVGADGCGPGCDRRGGS